MPPKKQNRKKLDLTHLAGLTASATSEQDKPNQELSDSSAQDSSETSDDASNRSPLKSDVEQFVPQDSAATTEESATAKPEAAPSPDEDVELSDRRQEIKKPLLSEFKSSKMLSCVTNTNGEVFKPGDKILAKSPWGARVPVEIKTVYQDSEGNAWAHYLPTEEQLPSGWSWLGGCTRATLLLKA
jgi:hypothetical protein